jgi:O-antigen ligase/tetratricopeptide (TPR) repeat protein
MKIMNINSAIHKALIGGLLLTPFISFIITQSMIFPFVTGKAFAFRILTEVLFLLWIILALKDERYRPQFSSIFGVVALFFISMGLSTIFAENINLSFWGNYERMEGFILLIHLLLYFIILISILKNQREWDWVWYSFMISSAIMGVYGLYQIKMLGISARIDGTFGNPTYLSVFMLLIFFIGFFQFIQKKLPLYAFILLMLLQLPVIYFTGTRGATIGLLGGLLLFSILITIGEKQNKMLRRCSSGFIIAFVAILLIFFAAKDSVLIQESPLLSRFANISVTEIAAKDSRLYVWPIAIEGFKDKPLLGWGQEGFRYVFDENYNPEMYDREGWYDRAHSIPLDWLIAGGLIGGGLYLAMFGVAFYVIWRQSQFSYTSKSILSGMFFAYTLQNLFVFDNLLSYIIYFSLLAYLHFVSTKKISPLVAYSFWQGANNLKIVPLVSIIIFGLAMYNFNYKPIYASQAFISGMKKLKVEKQSSEALAFFEESFKFNTSGNIEIIESTSLSASQFFLLETSPLLREQFFNLVNLAYKKQLDYFPNDTRSHFFYGQFLYQAGQAENALKELYKALELSPLRQNILFTIGAIYLDNAFYNDAVPIFKRYFEADKNFNKARLMYGVSLLYANDNKLAQEVLNDMPVNELIMSQPLVDVLIHRGDFKALVQLFNERLNLTPNDMTTNIKLAEFLIRTGDPDAAINLLEAYLSRNPQDEKDLRQYLNDMKASRKGIHPLKSKG